MEGFQWLLDSRSYMPHGHCYLWQPSVLWLQVGSDALIAAAYFTIPAILFYFVRRRRQDLPLRGIPLLFASFILLCGITHLLGIWTVWNPDYRLDGVVKLATGLVSVSTAVALWRVMPIAIALQTPAQLRREVALRTGELRAANARLEREAEQREATERRLRDSEERFRLATRALNGYIYEWTPADGRLWRSERFTDMLGLPPDSDLTPDGWRARIHPDDRERAAVILRALAHGDRDASAEYRVQTADGRWVWLWDHCVAVRDSQGTVIRIVGNVLDVSDRHRADEERRELLESERRARQEAERANRLKEEFLATLSHELRTPLSTVTMWARLLRQYAADPARVREAADVIDRNVRAQSRLISDLLDMSRIDAGKLTLDRQPLDLCDVIDAAFAAILPAANARQLTVTRTLGPVSGAVQADAARLQQVLSNMLSNSIKFTPPGGRIEIALAESDGGAAITVTDSGKGIDPAFLPHVFDRFRQQDGSHARDHGGLGLGLSIVREIVDLHGGRVTLESAGRDRGTTATVWLPLHDVVASVEPLSAPEPEGLPLAGIRVLIVDDDDDAREGLRRLVAGQGADVRSAASADEAQRVLKREPIDVLVSDLGMPSRDGFDLIRTLRAAGSSIRAAALTALARPEDRGRAIAAGFDRHLAKPVGPATLVATVRELAGAGGASSGERAAG
jgi:PAS domain S-box-containing protein